MLRYIAEVKEALQVMRYEFGFGVSHVYHEHEHVLLTHMATLRAPHSHRVSIVMGETEFEC
jgi:hypothetical protein